MRSLTDRDAARLLGLDAGAMPAWTQGVLLTDPSLPDNPIIYASLGFTSLTGYTMSEVLGRNCRFLQGKDTSPSTVAGVRAAVLSGARLDVDILNYRKNGAPFWNHLSLGVINTAEEGRLHVGLQFDVSFRHPPLTVASAGT